MSVITTLKLNAKIKHTKKANPHFSMQYISLSSIVSSFIQAYQ